MINHNKAMNMVDLINPLRNLTYNFLNENSDYPVSVTRYVKHSPSVFPLVEIKQLNTTNAETDLQRITQIDDYEFELNIYAKSKTDGEGNVITEVQVAEDIQYLINELFEVKLNMVRTFCQPTPNLDLDIYRITMRFTCSYNKRRNIFIRR